MSKLTPYKVDNLRPREKQYEVFDEGRPLAIRIGTTGIKSWVMFYRIAGRQRRLTIGRSPAMSLADARHLCEAHLKVVAAGIDPADQLACERARRREAPTVADLTTAYLERHAKRNKRSWRTDEGYFQRYIVPALGRRKAADVKRREVVELVEAIAEHAPVAANRAFATLRAAYSWAVRVDLVESSPCLHVRPPTKERPRDRVLSADEIRRVWAVLNSASLGGSEAPPMSEGTALALKLALATGQRIGEVCGAHWAEIDRKARLWTIPAARSKNGLEHRVPLSKLALEILARAAAVGGGSGFVFPGRGGLAPIKSQVASCALRRVRQERGLPDFTPHDLRRTAATFIASAGVSRVVISKLLNHAERGVTAVYDRAGYDQEKREALATWEAALLKIIGHGRTAEAGA